MREIASESRAAGAALEFKQCNYNRARGILDEATDEYPFSEEMWLQSADLELKKGNYNQARKILNEATEEYPDSGMLYMKFADLEVKICNYSGARQILDKATKIFPHSKKLWLHFTDYAIKICSYDQAKKILYNAINKYPDSEKLRMKFAELEIKHRNYREARVILNETSTKNLNSENFYIVFAFLEQRIGKYDKARKIMSEAVQKYADSEDLWLKFADFEIEQRGNYNQAREVLINATNKITNSEELWLKFADVEIEHDNCDLVTRILNKAVKKVPCSEELWMKFADFAVEKGSYNVVRKILNKATKNIPYSEVLWMKFVDIEAKHGNSNQSREVLKKATKYAPYSEDLWENLAKYGFKHGHYDLVEEILKKAIKVNPGLEKWWMKHAYVINEYKSLNIVIEKIEQALMCFAENSFEIKPLKWINAVKDIDIFDPDGENRVQFFNAVAPSFFRLFSDKDELDKCLSLSYQIEGTFLLFLCENFPEEKRVWVNAIMSRGFSHFEYQEHLFLLLKLACKIRPDNESLRNLIQCKKNSILKENCRCTHNFWQVIRYFKKIQDSHFGESEKKLIIEEFRENIKLSLEVQEELRSIVNFVNISENEMDKYGVPYNLEYMWLNGEKKAVWKFLEKAVKALPHYDKFWHMKAQIEIKKSKLNQAAETYNNAIESVPDDYDEFVIDDEVKESYGVDDADKFFKTHFIIQLFELEQRRDHFSEARHILESAKLKFQDDIRIWLSCIRFELQANERPKSIRLLNQAMVKFPTSGELWSQAIYMEERSKQEAIAIEGLKKCDHDEETKFVMLASAKLFFNRGNVKKSRKWFNKTVERYPMFKDAWIYFYKLEKLWGCEESARKVLFRFLIMRSEYAEYINDNCKHRHELWFKFKDHIDNWGLIDEELLEAIVDKKNIDARNV